MKTRGIKKTIMLKFILVAFLVIGFLVFSIPILIAEKSIGKTDPEKKGRQSLAIVRFMFRLILKVAGIHITVKGMENIPADTPVLYVGNHRSYFDILVGYTTVPTPMALASQLSLYILNSPRISEESRSLLPGNLWSTGTKSPAAAVLSTAI